MSHTFSLLTSVRDICCIVRCCCLGVAGMLTRACFCTCMFDLQLKNKNKINKLSLAVASSKLAKLRLN